MSGAEYFRVITANESDRRYRGAFQRAVLGLVPPGGRIFDFGSGPGIDGRFYAEHGRRVSAYDADPGMNEHLAEYCRDLIASGAVDLQGGSYREFLARAAPAARERAALVTANFAPLNLIADLPELFAKFAALTDEAGAVLASVLSPYFFGDLRYGWWWRNAGRLSRDGRYAVPGAEAPVWRRRLADLAAGCAPYFRLVTVYPGSELAFPAASGAWLRLIGCRYAFLLFRKNAPQTHPPAA